MDPGAMMDGCSVKCGWWIAGLVALISAPALAQSNLAGVWNSHVDEDWPDRIPGPELGDYTVRIAEGAPWRAIVAAAGEEAADAVAIGRHGADASGDGLLGSATDRVLRNAPCPVLVG